MPAICCRARSAKASLICRAAISRCRGRSPNALRLSFAGLTPEEIRDGLAHSRHGFFRAELETTRSQSELGAGTGYGVMEAGILA